MPTTTGTWVRKQIDMDDLEGVYTDTDINEKPCVTDEEIRVRGESNE